MKKNQLIALVIILITILGPLQFSLRPDALESTTIRGGLMLLTLLGTLAALFIGISNPAKAKSYVFRLYIIRRDDRSDACRCFLQQFTLLRMLLN
jgi:hypothetical protein